MGEFTQENRRLQIDTPLGKDVVIITGFTGTEAISRPFGFQLDLIAENKTNVSFAKLLGQSVTVRLTLSPGTAVDLIKSLNDVLGAARGEQRGPQAGKHAH